MIVDMNGGFAKFKAVISSPEFQLVWVLLAVTIVAFVVDFIVVTSGFLLLIEGALLLIIFALAFGTVYGAVSSGRDTKIGRSELAGILESMEDAIVIYEEGFRAIFFNPAAEKLFRLPA